MASLYSNENFPKRVVEELRRLGHDVLTSYETGRGNQRIPDSFFQASFAFAAFFAATFFTGRGGKSKPILPSFTSKVRWASNLRLVRLETKPLRTSVFPLPINLSIWSCGISHWRMDLPMRMPCGSFLVTISGT